MVTKRKQSAGFQASSGAGGRGSVKLSAHAPPAVTAAATAASTKGPPAPAALYCSTLCLAPVLDMRTEMRSAVGVKPLVSAQKATPAVALATPAGKAERASAALPSPMTGKEEVRAQGAAGSPQMTAMSPPVPEVAIRVLSSKLHSAMEAGMGVAVMLALAVMEGERVAEAVSLPVPEGAMVEEADAPGGRDWVAAALVLAVADTEAVRDTEAELEALLVTVDEGERLDTPVMTRLSMRRVPPTL